MNDQAPTDLSFIKAVVFLAVWFTLLTAIYIPSTMNLALSQKIMVFGALAFTCLIPAILAAVLSRRKFPGYSWLKFGSVYTIVLIIVHVLIGALIGL